MRDKNHESQQWGTRVGYIIAAAMAMAGLGNVWRFPNLVGRYGGAAFLIPYLILLFVVAIPGEWAEALLGKVTKQGTVGAYRASHRNLTGNGFITTILSTGVASYYVVICGWVFAYLGYAVSGTLMNIDPAVLWDSINPDATGDMAWLIAVLSVTILAICCFVSLRGVQSGIEKVNKVLAPCLFIILIILAIRGLTLKGSSAGVDFYMNTDWSMVFRPVTWIMALSQVLFSIGPNWGIYTTYGRYMKQKDELPMSYLTSCLADTSVALLAGWAIFPALFVYGLDTTSGYNLAFVALSTVFKNMPGGRFFAVIFFVALFMAAISTIFGFMQVGICNLVDEFKDKDSKKLTVGLYLVIAALSVPAAVIPNWISIFDTWVGCYILPIAMIILYVSIAYTRNVEVIRLKYLNCYSDIYIGKWWNWDIKYVQPLLVLVIWAFWIYSAVVEQWGFLLGVGGLAISVISCLILIWLGVIYAQKHPGDASPDVLS